MHLLISFLVISFPSFVAAQTVSCSKSIFGTTYSALVDITNMSNATIIITASNNRATERGEQSERLVAEQRFNHLSSTRHLGVVYVTFEDPEIEIESSTSHLNYAELSNNDDHYELFVRGKALPFLNKMDFKKCELI